MRPGKRKQGWNKGAGRRRKYSKGQRARAYGVVAKY